MTKWQVFSLLYALSMTMMIIKCDGATVEYYQEFYNGEAGVDGLWRVEESASGGMHFEDWTAMYGLSCVGLRPAAIGGPTAITRPLNDTAIAKSGLFMMTYVLLTDECAQVTVSISGAEECDIFCLQVSSTRVELRQRDVVSVSASDIVIPTGEMVSLDIYMVHSSMYLMIYLEQYGYIVVANIDSSAIGNNTDWRGVLHGLAQPSARIGVSYRFAEVCALQENDTAATGDSRIGIFDFYVFDMCDVVFCDACSDPDTCSVCRNDRIITHDRKWCAPIECGSNTTVTGNVPLTRCVPCETITNLLSCNYNVDCTWCEGEGTCKYTHADCHTSCTELENAAICYKAANCIWLDTTQPGNAVMSGRCRHRAEFVDCAAVRNSTMCVGTCSWCEMAGRCFSASATCNECPTYSGKQDCIDAQVSDPELLCNWCDSIATCINQAVGGVSCIRCSVATTKWQCETAQLGGCAWCTSANACIERENIPVNSTDCECSWRPKASCAVGECRWCPSLTTCMPRQDCLPCGSLTADSTACDALPGCKHYGGLCLDIDLVPIVTPSSSAPLVIPPSNGDASDKLPVWAIVVISLGLFLVVTGIIVAAPLAIVKLAISRRNGSNRYGFGSESATLDDAQIVIELASRAQRLAGAAQFPDCASFCRALGISIAGPSVAFDNTSWPGTNTPAAAIMVFRTAPACFASGSAATSSGVRTSGHTSGLVASALAAVTGARPQSTASASSSAVSLTMPSSPVPPRAQPQALSSSSSGTKLLSSSLSSSGLVLPPGTASPGVDSETKLTPRAIASSSKTKSGTGTGFVTGMGTGTGFVSESTRSAVIPVGTPCGESMTIGWNLAQCESLNPEIKLKSKAKTKMMIELVAVMPSQAAEQNLYEVYIEPSKFELDDGDSREVAVIVTPACSTDAEFGIAILAMPPPELANVLRIADKSDDQEQGAEEGEAEEGGEKKKWRGYGMVRAKFSCGVSTRLSPLDVACEKELGRGANAAVYKGRWKSTEVAVKVFRLMSHEIEEERGEIVQEVDTMTRIKSPYIVTFFGMFKNIPAREIGLVMELAPLGGLSGVLDKLTPRHHLRFAAEVAHGLAYLHANSYMHRDIKPDNVLVFSLNLSAAICVKISDLGTCRSVSQEEAQKYTKGMGTPIYMAPEILSGKPYNSACDIYSYAIALWSMVSGTVPFEQLTMFEIGRSVIAGIRPELSAIKNHPLAEIIVACWDPDHTKRPTADTVIGSIASISSV